jgi:hypothetical protein
VFGDALGIRTIVIFDGPVSGASQAHDRRPPAISVSGDRGRVKCLHP